MIILSLVSQTKKQIKIEIVTDVSVVVHKKHDGCGQGQDHVELVDKGKYKAELTMLVNVSSKEILLTPSEVGWISNSKLLLTINNEYHLINMQHKKEDWIKLENNIQYVKQHIDMQMFVSLMRFQKPLAQLMRGKNGRSKAQSKFSVEPDLVKSQRSVQLMDIASFSRYAFIKKARFSKE